MNERNNESLPREPVCFLKDRGESGRRREQLNTKVALVKAGIG